MTANFLKTVLVAVAWLVVLQRGYMVYREQHARSNKPVSKVTQSHQKIVWVSSVLLLFAGMTWSNAYIQFASANFGQWFLHIPKVTFGVIAFIVYTYGSARHILPDRYPVWPEWLIVAGILVIGNFTLLEWLGWHVFPDRVFEYQRLAGLILKSYLFIAILKMGLPAMRRCQTHEPGIILQIRLGALWWFNFFFLMWMGVDIGVLILALGTESSVFALPFVMGFFLMFIMGLFVPDRFYKRYLVFFYHLGTFLRVRLVELLAYYELALVYKHCALSWHEVIRSPEHATYKSVISVLDSSKMLCAQSEPTVARSLGQKISLAHSVHSDYLGVVNHLREVGTEYLANIETLKMLYHLLRTQSGQSPRQAVTQ